MAWTVWRGHSCPWLLTLNVEKFSLGHALKRPPHPRQAFDLADIAPPGVLPFSPAFGKSGNHGSRKSVLWMDMDLTLSLALNGELRNRTSVHKTLHETGLFKSA